MKGSYILVVFIQKNIHIQIGALGTIEFIRGFYVYIGSAMGNSGSTTLINRVRRHLSSSEGKKKHWHIDYLLDNKDTSIFCIYLIPSLQKLECLIAKEFLSRVDRYINKFGSSDCHCTSHLLYFEDFKQLKQIFR
jgi:Uri superfamily endonuclease